MSSDSSPAAPASPTIGSPFPLLRAGSDGGSTGSSGVDSPLNVAQPLVRHPVHIGDHHHHHRKALKASESTSSISPLSQTRLMLVGPKKIPHTSSAPQQNNNSNISDDSSSSTISHGGSTHTGTTSSPLVTQPLPPGDTPIATPSGVGPRQLNISPLRHSRIITTSPLNVNVQPYSPPSGSPCDTPSSGTTPLLLKAHIYPKPQQSNTGNYPEFDLDFMIPTPSPTSSNSPTASFPQFPMAGADGSSPPSALNLRHLHTHHPHSTGEPFHPNVLSPLPESKYDSVMSGSAGGMDVAEPVEVIKQTLEAEAEEAAAAAADADPKETKEERKSLSQERLQQMQQQQQQQMQHNSLPPLHPRTNALFSPQPSVPFHVHNALDQLVFQHNQNVAQNVAKPARLVNPDDPFPDGVEMIPASRFKFREGGGGGGGGSPLTPQGCNNNNSSLIGVGHLHRPPGGDAALPQPPREDEEEGGGEWDERGEWSVSFRKGDTPFKRTCLSRIFTFFLSLRFFLLSLCIISLLTVSILSWNLTFRAAQNTTDLVVSDYSDVLIKEIGSDLQRRLRIVDHIALINQRFFADGLLDLQVDPQMFLKTFFLQVKELRNDTNSGLSITTPRGELFGYGTYYPKGSSLYSVQWYTAYNASTGARRFTESLVDELGNPTQVVVDDSYFSQANTTTWYSVVNTSSPFSAGWTSPYFFNRHWFVSQSSALYNANHQPLGVITADFQLSFIDSLCKQVARASNISTDFLVVDIITGYVLGTSIDFVLTDRANSKGMYLFNGPPLLVEVHKFLLSYVGRSPETANLSPSTMYLGLEALDGYGSVGVDGADLVVNAHGFLHSTQIPASLTSNHTSDQAWSDAHAVNWIIVHILDRTQVQDSLSNTNKTVFGATFGLSCGFIFITYMLLWHSLGMIRFLSDMMFKIARFEFRPPLHAEIQTQDPDNTAENNAAAVAAAMAAAVATAGERGTAPPGRGISPTSASSSGVRSPGISQPQVVPELNELHSSPFSELQHIQRSVVAMTEAFRQQVLARTQQNRQYKLQQQKLSQMSHPSI